VKWDQQAWNFSISDCANELRASDPVIEVLGADNPSLVKAVREGIPTARFARTRSYRTGFHDDQAREEMIVGQRLRAVLSAAQKKAA